MNTINIKIQDIEFTATLFDNATADELNTLLPIKITLKDLNHNEKYHNFSYEFNSNPQMIKQIHKGDIMLYQNNCLVIFYKDFETSYRYTPIGKISDPEKLDIIHHTSDITAAIYELK